MFGKSLERDGGAMICF